MPTSLLSVRERQVADLFIPPLDGLIDAELLDAPLSPAPSGTIAIIATTSGNPTQVPVLSGTVTIIATTAGNAIIITAAKAPVANAGPGITAQEPWFPFALDGSASYDPNVGDTLTPLWTLTTGNPAEVTITNPNALVTNATVSPKTVENLTYVFTLKVTDPGGLSGSATKTVTVLRASESTPRDGIDVPIRITSA